MSTSVMAQCWPLRMPPTAKAVLISLADNANDQGHCWPAISTICIRTCFSKRAVIDAIAWLEAANALRADRTNGRHTTYVITPAQYAEPVQHAHRYSSRTGAAPALEPVQLPHQPVHLPRQPVRETHTNRQEPPLTIKSNPVSCAGAGEAGQVDGSEAGTSPEPHVAACMAMIRAGIPAAFVQQTSPDLAVLIAAGHEPDEFGRAAVHALTVKAHRAAFSYALGIVRNGGGKARGSPSGGKPKPTATDNFKETTYVGTAIEQLSPELRRHLEQQQAG